jgi:acetyl-CoA C-acetyltransferase
LSHSSIEELISEVALEAIADAKVPEVEIDAIFLGVCESGFTHQSFPAGLMSMISPVFRHTPATRIENACGTGSAAVLAAVDAIKSGRAGTVLVIGAEKMTARPTAEIVELMRRASYGEEREIPGGFAGIFGHLAGQYFNKYGDKGNIIARIAAKNHKNGCENPYAHFQKDLGFEFCNTVSESNPIVAGPLRRSDCSPISDGAAAIMLTNNEGLARAEKGIAIKAMVQANDFMSVKRRNSVFLEGASIAWSSALEKAGVTIEDLDLVETHDCFSIAELLQYEAMGLAPPGEGDRVVKEGLAQKDGRLPINPSGGLKSRGHPLGATGVSMQVMCAMQLMDAAGGMQIKGASLAGAFNMGGVGVANYASILERIK